LGHLTCGQREDQIKGGDAGGVVNGATDFTGPVLAWVVGYRGAVMPKGEAKFRPEDPRAARLSVRVREGTDGGREGGGERIAGKKK